MNYTINEIPDTAEEVNNTDYAIMWQDKTKKISISNLFKKLVKKSEVTSTISAINENPITSKAVSSLLTISASTTTITDAPPLQNGITLRIFFTSEIAGTDNTTVLQITYNGTSYNVKVPKDGALQNYVAFEVSSGVFKYLQAYTTLELLFDGTQFVIIGNPVVLSGSNYLYYADGSHNTNEVTSGNMQSVTSNAVYPIKEKTDQMYDDNLLKLVRYLPVIKNYDLPSQSTDDNVYFKEWFDWMYNHHYFDDYLSVFIGQANPNYQVMVWGFTYEDPYLWSLFYYMKPTNPLFRFGYRNGVWFLEEEA